MGKLQLLKRSTNFTNYFLADIISNFGTGMSFIGLNWFILEKTAKSSNVGLFMGITLFSGLISFIFAGTAADRYNRRDILIFSNLFRGILIAVAAWLLLMNPGNEVALFSIAIINGLGWGLYQPASRGLIHEVLEKDEIVAGNSVLEISLQMGSFLAGGASGFVYQWVGILGVLIIDIVTYYIAVVLMLNIKYQRIIASDRELSFFTQFANGFRYLNAHKILFTLGVLSMVPAVITVSTNVVLPGYIRNHLHGSTVAFGISDMSYGFAAFIAGLLVGEILKRISPQKVIITLFSASTVALVLLFINHFIAGLYVWYFILGMSNTSLKIILSSVLMEYTEKEQFGRAMSVWLSISSLLQVAFAYFIGYVIDRIPANFGYLVLAIGMFAGFLAYLTTLLVIGSKADADNCFGQ